MRTATTGIILVAAAQVFSLALLIIPQDLMQLTSISGWAALFRWQSVLFYLIAIVLLAKTKIHPVLIVAAGAVFGILFL